MLYNLRRQVGKSNFNLYGASILPACLSRSKTRDMQANPCHFKTQKKNVDTGDSPQRKIERRSQRECMDPFRARSKEVGVRFKDSGKVVEIHCSCLRPFTGTAKKIFYASTFIRIEMDHAK